MKQLDESKEAEFPISVLDLVLQNNVQWHRRAETQFLKDQVFTKNPSPTWSSIVHGLNLLKEGLIWQIIGDGRKVRIWQDNWLLRKEELKFSLTGFDQD
jgi:hypothetical protein